MDMDVEIVTARRAVLTLRGGIDVYSAPLLRQRIVDLDEEGVHTIVLDLGSVEFVDQTGIGVLTEASKRLASHGGSIALVLSDEPVVRLEGSDTPAGALQVYRSRDEALLATG